MMTDEKVGGWEKGWWLGKRLVVGGLKSCWLVV
jgi:hypothetical protein